MINNIKKINIKNPINQRVKLFLDDILDKKGISLKALCLELNLSYSHVSQIQRGAKRLTFDIAQVFCKECNMNLNYIAKGEGTMYQETIENRIDKLEAHLFPKTYDQN